MHLSAWRFNLSLMWDELGPAARTALIAQLAAVAASYALADSKPGAHSPLDLGHDRQAFYPVAGTAMVAHAWVGAPPQQPVVPWPTPPYDWRKR